MRVTRSVLRDKMTLVYPSRSKFRDSFNVFPATFDITTNNVKFYQFFDRRHPHELHGSLFGHFGRGGKT